MQKGVQKTEEMLVSGSTITVVGEVVAGPMGVRWAPPPAPHTATAPAPAPRGKALDEKLNILPLTENVH